MFELASPQVIPAHTDVWAAQIAILEFGCTWEFWQHSACTPKFTSEFLELQPWASGSFSSPRVVGQILSFYFLFSGVGQANSCRENWPYKVYSLTPRNSVALRTGADWLPASWSATGRAWCWLGLIDLTLRKNNRGTTSWWQRGRAEERGPLCLLGEAHIPQGCGNKEKNCV
jgi:hypothetical protein